jgi:murein L,D-transpeptidase YafK
MKRIQLIIVAAAMAWITGCGPSAPSGVRGGTYSGGCAQTMSGTVADSIVVDKSDRKMYLYSGGSLIKTFPVSLGANDYQGPKVKQGDKRTPIGTYRILNKRCHSVKYMAMTISYPNAADVARAKAAGVNPGSLITIHGQPHWNADGHGDAFTLSKDWTDGCIALTNSGMRELWSMVRVGTSITLRQ